MITKTRPKKFVSSLLSALFVSFFLSACGHSEKLSETSSAAPDRSVSSVFLFEREPMVIVPEEAPTPEERANFAASTTARSTDSDLSLVREEPSRDIASVPETSSPPAQAEHRWFPWMTIVLGLLLAFALAASVRSIRNSPRP